jgi:hypothetical protein
VRPRLEVLEGRRVLSTLIVTSNADGPFGNTLREEIAVARPGDTIVFDPSLDRQTITLGYGHLEINKDLTIKGPGAGLLAINGGGGFYSSRVFQADANTNVTISGLTIEGGTGEKYGPSGNFDFTPDSYDGYGGGILNLGTLTLSGCAVTGNYASGYQVGWAFGGSPEGGGIFNHGTMTLSGCTVTGNSADPYQYYSGYGGGIYNGGTMTLSGCNVTGNTAYDSYLTSAIFVQGAGGGIFNAEQGSLTILSSVVLNNTASDGADICSLGSIKISKDSQVGKVSHK